VGIGGRFGSCAGIMRLRDRRNRFGQRIDAIAAFKDVRDGAPAILVGHPADSRGNVPCRFDPNAEIADDIAGDVIEARAYDQETRTNASREGRH